MVSLSLVLSRRGQGGYIRLQNWDAIMSAPRKAGKHLNELLAIVKAVLLGRPNLSLENRRGHQRLRLRVPIACKLLDEEHPAELLDISATGMRVLMPCPVHVEDTIRVSAIPETGLVGRQRLICRVAWVRPHRPEWEVGLEYHDTDENLAHSWVQLALRHLDPDQVNRRSRRIPANLRVHVANVEGELVGRGLCVNLSTGGCLLEMDRPLLNDEVVKLGIGPNETDPNIFLSGRVLRHIPGGDVGKYLHHIQFFPGENRNHQRLRSLMLTLLEELKSLDLKVDEEELDWENEREEDQISLFQRLSHVTPAPAPPPPPPELPPVDFDATPGPAQLTFTPGAPLPLGAPVEFGVGTRVPVPAPTRPVPMEELHPSPPPPAPSTLSQLIGPLTQQVSTRSYALRSTSLWAARSLPVRSRKIAYPQETATRTEPHPADPGDRDFMI